MPFLIGTIFGLIGGAYLTYRYHATIQGWLDMSED